MSSNIYKIMIYSHAMLHRSKLKIVLSIIFVFTAMNALLTSQYPVMAQQQQQQQKLHSRRFGIGK